MLETSENRSSQNVPYIESTPNQINNQNIIRSYSQITQQTQAMFPTREQAIILSAVDGLKLADYIIAVGNIIEPKNITFASRISNNRICIYLSNTQLVEQFVTENSTITVQDKLINVRKLVTPARRIIISNVCPTIPHTIISNVLRGIGLKLVSSVSFMRAGIPGGEYSHILSFRRQVYIQPEEVLELPPSVVIKHENTSYRIFLTFDDMTCFLCKKSGHLAKDCPIADNQLQSRTPSQQVTEFDMLIDIDNNSQTQQIATPTDFSTPLNLCQSLEVGDGRPQKRPVPSITSSADSPASEELEETPPNSQLNLSSESIPRPLTRNTKKRVTHM